MHTSRGCKITDLLFRRDVNKKEGKIYSKAKITTRSTSQSASSLCLCYAYSEFAVGSQKKDAGTKTPNIQTSKDTRRSHIHWYESTNTKKAP